MRKEKDGERRGLGNVLPQAEGGLVLRPKRMNLSTKKNNIGQQTPHNMVPRAPLQAVRSAPRAQNSKSFFNQTQINVGLKYILIIFSEV